MDRHSVLLHCAGAATLLVPLGQADSDSLQRAEIDGPWPAAGLGVMAISPAGKGRGSFMHHRPNRWRTAPCPPLELAYRFLIDQGISTLRLGAEQPGELAWAAALARFSASREGWGQSSPGECWLYPEHLGVERCGQCRPCLPCTNGVPIPELLRLSSLAVGHGMSAFASERYCHFVPADSWWEALNAEVCRSCSAYLPRCPHELPIQALLADTHHRLSPAPRRRLWS